MTENDIRNPFLKAALEYHRRGFVVIPCIPRQKRPMLAWSKVKQTEELIREWWKEEPRANVAIATGRKSGVIVVDIDRRHGGTLDGLEDTDLIAETKDGWHCYFAVDKNHPDLIPSTASRDSDENRVGRDVKADGGIVMVPPSIHPDDHTFRYKWLKSGDPAKAPQWVYSRSANASVGENRDYTWIRKVLLNVPKGRRNNAITQVAGYLAGKTVAREVAETVLVLAASRWDDPPDEDEVAKTVESVYRTEYRKVKDGPKPDTDRPKFDVIHWSAFLDQYTDAGIQWAIDGWMPENSVAMLVAPPGSYKTWLALEAACAYSTGSPFLGIYPVNQRGPAIVIQQEDFLGQTAARLSQVLEHRLPSLGFSDGVSIRDPALMDVPLYVHTDRVFTFTDKRVLDETYDLLCKLRPKFMFIDPLYQVVTVDEYMTKAVKDMDVLKQWRDEFGCTFMIVHHTTKTEDWGRMKAWGSQFINAFVESLWHTRKIEGQPWIGLRRYFKAAGEAQLLKVDFDIDTELGIYDVDVSDLNDPDLSKAVSENSVLNRAVREHVFKSLAAKGPMTEKNFIDSGICGTEKQLQRVLRTLHETGNILYDAQSRTYSLIEFAD